MWRQRLLSQLSPLLRTNPLRNPELRRLLTRTAATASPLFNNHRLRDPRVSDRAVASSSWFSGSRFWSVESASSREVAGAWKCWNCDFVLKTKVSLVCENCRCVQPVDHSVNYFQIFGLEKKFGIEESGLDGKYKDWQKKLHPDLVHSKSERERAYAAEQSSRVIDAYRTLSNPLSRAIYLMKLDGVHVDEEQTVSDLELLAEIMEIREAVEEAADSQGLRAIQSQVREKQKKWSESFSKAFQSLNTEEALDSIRRMTYYKRVDEEIVKKL